MKQGIGKPLFGSIGLLLLLTAGVLSCLHWQFQSIGPVGTRIMQVIDDRTQGEGSCIAALDAVTDFEWDTAVLVSADLLAAGHSDAYLSEIWGFPYAMQGGYRSHLIFVKEGQVVYEESYPASIEAPVQLNVSLYPPPYYRIYSVEDCEVACHCTDGHYSIVG